MTVRQSTVSVVVPCRNEAANVGRFIDMLMAQTRQPDEVLIVDGMSTDSTREKFGKLAPEGLNLRIVDNPDLIVPSALNAGLAAAKSTYFCRMDMHAVYGNHYLEALLGLLDENPDIPGAGGAMATAGVGEWGTAIAAVLSTPIGMGGARHRIGGAAGPIQHAFSATYRRDALLLAGGWDTRFKANEDFEADLRVAAAAGALWLEPAAECTWYVRETPGALSRQMFKYGYYKGLTIWTHPKSLRLRQLVPPTLVALLSSGLIWRGRASRQLRGTALAYLIVSASTGAMTAGRAGADWKRGTFVPALIHISWGAGLLAGTVRFLPELLQESTRRSQYK